MSKLHIWGILVGVGVVMGLVLGSQPILVKSYSGLVPANSYQLGFLNAADTIQVHLSWPSPSRPTTTAHLWKSPMNTYLPVLLPQSQITSTPNSYSFTHITGINYRFLVFAQSTELMPVYYNIRIYVNGNLVVLDGAYVYGVGNYPVVLVSTLKGCRGTAILSGPSGILQITDFQSPPLNTTTSPILQFSLPKSGNYFIMYRSYTHNIYNIISYTINVYSYCDSFCVNPDTPYYTPGCALCGNAILEQGEQCDNGNKLGCQQCLTTPGYQCNGNLGSSSQCSKPSICGDGILDTGEQCDNGNQIGCSSGCLPDTGFKCGGTIGWASSCSFCGNGIVEAGEECDNGNAVGCSAGCKVDAGFECRGVNSVCFRKNPVCGNGVGQVGEACDDGNNINGDGCSQFCLIEQGYTCSGQLNERSTCEKSNSCGNSIFEPATQQCDNSNQVGCRGCVVEQGYECINNEGFASTCLRGVVIHCGNHVLEPQTGQICDDGNNNNGDGCNSYCQLQPGWIMISPNYYLTLQEVQSNCGNSKLQQLYTQQCDDGNKQPNDGCSPTCKIEPGWTCTVNDPVLNRSICERMYLDYSYCGNGVVERGETCDDGFPLRNGDGCSVRCQVQQGWFCQFGQCWRV